MSEEQRKRLWDLYYDCRFQELIALDLVNRAAFVEKIMLWILLVSITTSLMTGSISLLNVQNLAWIWASLSVIATVASIFSLAHSPSDRRFLHHSIAKSFNSLALECENFTEFAVHLAGAREKVDEFAHRNHRDYIELINRTDFEHRRYGQKQARATYDRLDTLLQIEGKVKPEADVKPKAEVK